MLNRPPSWWYSSEPEASFVARALHPIGLLYGELALLRWRLQTPYRSSLPVICIGNFVAGGAGKTPLAIAIAEKLKDQGETPFFLSRGYGGKITGPHLIDRDHDTASDVGDEPLVLVQHAPTVISRDRKAGALFIESQGATLIVMDDGFQNPTLKKDLSLIAVDRQTGLGNGKIIPAGPLRAPLAFQKDHADAVILLSEPSRQVHSHSAEALRGLPILAADIAPHGDTQWLSGAQIIAFAGIGNPEKFFATLRGLGADILAGHAFPDHHVFSEQDAKRLLGLARERDLPLVTTEKDWLRLSGRHGQAGTLREKAQILNIEIVFEQTTASQLTQLINDALQAKRAA